MLDRYDRQILDCLQDTPEGTTPTTVARALGRPLEEMKYALIDLVLSGHIGIADGEELHYVLTSLGEAARREPAPLPPEHNLPPTPASAPV